MQMGSLSGHDDLRLFESGHREIERANYASPQYRTNMRSRNVVDRAKIFGSVTRFWICNL